MKAMRATILGAALLLCVAAANAASKVTAGVGHMCCGKCRAAATTGLAKVAEGVTIDGDNITLSPKGDDLLPTIEALRKSGFPARTIPVTGPVTLGIAHLCCGTCRTGLTKAFAAAKLEAVDLDSIKVTDDTVTLNAKSGMKIDLIPMLAAMEQGGFYPNKITVASVAAHRSSSAARRVALR